MNEALMEDKYHFFLANYKDWANVQALCYEPMLGTVYFAKGKTVALIVACNNEREMIDPEILYRKFEDICLRYPKVIRKAGNKKIEFKIITFMKLDDPDKNESYFVRERTITAGEQVIL